ncbi:bola-like protein [Metschnikowia bicuspidata var. bicuspidata NRRL YB-4993]|uniref:Bola-like protein n=1 Tax=Metschnikowia bicuspidata var. bicuspidata NRRL YB-4993 TaxID=869754 RepID=A0A1A0H661_9ASCO|nr:bola-like protein [Metschnikowia bicuspidata var. bicuspidata NRRL YB-4993]OBA19574.1 bola-like protein [Metschnikowia bicuspidata var. bicuspidata NRRL YB-4993]
MSASATQIVRSSEAAGPIEELIIAKISANLKPSFLKIANDSHKHSHHQPMQDASNVKESHFRLEVVSEEFQGKNMPARHRLIYLLLDDEFQNQGLHALQMKTKTAEEAEKAKKR